MKGFSLVERYENPVDKAAIQTFLSGGGEITRCAPSAHGTCEKRKGVQIKRTAHTEVRKQGPRDLMADPTTVTPFPERRR